MKGYLLQKIERPEDLKSINFDFLLKDYPFEDLKGVHALAGPDTDPNYPGETEFEPVGRKKITFLNVVHGRFFPEEVDAYVDAQGNLYITDEQLEAML